MENRHVGARFTLDGEPVNITEFLADNAHDPETVTPDAIQALDVGEEITYGGGAAAVFVLRRVA